jgi:hypothetical protein
MGANYVRPRLKMALKVETRPPAIDVDCRAIKPSFYAVMLTLLPDVDELSLFAADVEVLLDDVADLIPPPP